MSSSSSIFQLLPLHIIESIIDYTGVTSHVDYQLDMQAVLAILHSCQTWRSYFLKQACSFIHFVTDMTNSPEFTFSLYSHNIIPLTHATSQHVRCLNICTEGWEYVMDGSLLTLMLETDISNVVFSSATKLLFQFDMCNEFSTIFEDSTIAAIQNITAFMQQIRKIVPNAKSAEIMWGATEFASFDQNIDFFIVDCVIYIIRNLRSSDFGQYESPNRITQPVPESFSGLSYFKCYDSIDSIWVAKLACYNAGTLKSLITFDFCKRDFKSLLYNSNSEPVIYPFLKNLKLERMLTLDTEIGIPDGFFRDRGNNISHFPVLESFLISSKFPFVDNVFMPGKNDTLKHLSIIHDGDPSEQINCVYQKYLKTCFYNLSSISVGDHNSKIQFNADMHTHQIDFLQSCLSYSNNVTRFTNYSAMDKYRFLQEVQSISLFQSLQLLDIQNTVLSFSDIIVLLQRVPFLQHLECGINEKAPTIKGVGPSKLPSYISSMNPLSRLLQSIRLYANLKSSIKHIAKTAILLAIGCPRLTSFGCRRFFYGEISYEIDNISKTKLFSNYTEQCQFISSRILFE